MIMRETTKHETADDHSLALACFHCAFIQAAEPSLADKTLVAWVRLDNLDQTGSGVLAIQDGDEFDAITFGERVQGRWMAGSHGFSRTQSAEEPAAAGPGNRHAQTSGCKSRWSIAESRSKSGATGERYAAYEAPNQQTYSTKCDLYLGLRCIFGQKPLRISPRRDR